MTTTKRGVTFQGRLKADPEFFAAVGTNQARARFTIVEVDYELDANNNAVVDPETGYWVEKNTVFHDAVVFGNQAEKIAATLQKGDPVLAIGDLKYSNFVDGEGRTRTGQDVIVRSIGIDFTRARGEVTIERPKAAPAQPAADAQPAPTARPSARQRAGVR